MTAFRSWLEAAATRYGDRCAISFEDDAVSYRDLHDSSCRLAAGLKAIGVTENDHVAILMDNSLECVRSWFASAIIGCTEIPLNPHYTGELLRYFLEDSGAQVIICDQRYYPQLSELIPSLGTLKTIVVNGTISDGVKATAGINTVAYSDLANIRIQEGLPASSLSAGRVILYTSGTTGPSKGVVHSPRTCLNLGRYIAEVLEYDRDDRLLNFFPLYHQNARYTGVVTAISIGAMIRLERRFSSSRFWEICNREHITAFNYLGSVLRMIMNHTPADFQESSHTIRKAYGVGANPTIWAEFENRLGIRLTEAYGLTEAPMATVNSRKRKSPIGSAGTAGDLFDIAIVDQQDEFVPAGTVGEIVVRPRRPNAFMLGYYNKDAATVLAFRNLWFHTGDRGRLSEGHLYFEAREKDAIRRRGENISAWEVESVLEKHPDVLESAVYGLPSAEADEDVAAALVLRTPDANLASILNFAAERLPKFAVPTLVRVLDELPRTDTVKVQKAELRAGGRTACISADAILRDGK